MLIELRLARGATRRWHDALRAKLLKAGHDVRVSFAGEAARQVSGLDLLMRFEGMVYGHAGAGGGASLPCAIVASGGGEAAGLVVDLTGSGLPVHSTGGPTLAPLWDGTPSELGAVAALLDRKVPLLSVVARAPDGGAGQVVASGSPGLEEPEVFSASFDRVCGRMGDLLVMAVRRIGEAGPGAGAAGEAPRSVRAPAPLGFAFSTLAAKVAGRLTRLARQAPRWRVGWRLGEDDAVLDRLRWPDAGYRVLKDDGQRYFADPFIFRHAGVTHVFCEEFPFATGRGILSVFDVTPEGVASAPRPVLDLPWHLSYPQIFEEDGSIYMIPESGANRTIELWRATRFPDRWEQVAVLVDNVLASDATLARHAGRYWIFATVSEGGESTWDALSLFHADALRGPWRAHSGNPVLIDAASARPAGLTRSRGSALLRPAQNCVAGYGAGLTICRVDRLDEDGFEQTILASLAAPEGLRATGVHTLNASDGVEVIDFFGGSPAG